MTFPATVLDIAVELFIDGVWTDITDDCQTRDGGVEIDIKRGKQDEASVTQPTDLKLTVNNRLGKYSPHNPVGLYYGKIGRNTPIRVKVGSSIRCVCEVSSWPAKWDVSGNDAYVEIEAAGIGRRLGQGVAISSSGLRDAIETGEPWHYWPLTGGVGTTYSLDTVGNVGRFAANIATGPDAPIFSYGSGDLGSYLAPSFQYESGSAAALMRGDVGLNDAGPICGDFVYKSSELGPLSFLLQDFNDLLWMVDLRGDGANNDIQLRIQDNTGVHFGPGPVAQGNTGVLACITDELVHHVRLSLTTSGADIAWDILVDGVSVLNGTLAGFNVNGCDAVFFNYVPVAPDTAVAIGHLTVWSSATTISATDLTNAMNGYAGELAGDRFERVCNETGILFSTVGTTADTIAMGPQYSDGFLELVREIEATDLGLLYEARDFSGLTYRTRVDLYNQTAAVAIDLSANELAHPFEPIEDDQNTRNDIFAQRREGGSYQATLTTGRLSIQDPPDGVGRYKDEAQVNVENDELLPGVAGFLLGRGTVDEARFPSINVDRSNPNVVANAVLTASLLTADIGDRLVISDAAAKNFYDDISLLILGYRETLSNFKHKFSFNCVPASPYDFAVYGDTVGDGPDRYDTSGSELDALVTSGATTLLVESVDTMWTTNASEFPFDIFVGGERMTVTDIDGGQPTFVGVGTSATGNNASVTPGLPAGVAVGDAVLILASIRNSGAGSPNTPSNWTLLAGGGTNFELYGRIYDGVWTMPTVTFTGGVANADTIAQSCAFRTVGIAGLTSTFGSNLSQQSIDVGQVIASSSGLNGVDLVMGWKQDDWTSVATIPNGYAEVGEQVSTAGDDAGQVWDYRITRAGGNTGGDFIVTGGASAIGRYMVVFLPRSPQIFTVTRSVNGVVKGHAAGTAVRLWKTPRYGM